MAQHNHPGGDSQEDGLPGLCLPAWHNDQSHSSTLNKVLKHPQDKVEGQNQQIDLTHPQDQEGILHLCSQNEEQAVEVGCLAVDVVSEPVNHPQHC